MRIYVLEAYHDNDVGIYTTLKKALAVQEENRQCEVVEKKDWVDGEFLDTGLVVLWWSCENCGFRERSDRREPIFGKHGLRYGPYFCSEACQQETEEFYASGKRGVHGMTTRQVKEEYPDGTDGVPGLAASTETVQRGIMAQFETAPPLLGGPIGCPGITRPGGVGASEPPETGQSTEIGADPSGEAAATSEGTGRGE